MDLAIYKGQGSQGTATHTAHFADFYSAMLAGKIGGRLVNLRAPIEPATGTVADNDLVRARRRRVKIMIEREHLVDACQGYAEPFRQDQGRMPGYITVPVLNCVQYKNQVIAGIPEFGNRPVDFYGQVI